MVLPRLLQAVAPAVTLICGGTSPYIYLWSNTQTNATATNLSAATYSVTISDGHGCKAFSSVLISQPSALSISASSNSPICSTNPLNLSSTVAGGTPFYSYAWTGPSSFSSTVANPAISNSVVSNTGYYTLVVTDANNCTSTVSTQVEVNDCFITLILNLYF